MRWLWFICLSHCFSLGKVSVIIELFSKRQYARIAFFGGFTNTFFIQKQYIYLKVVNICKYIVVNIYILV